jgi:translation initiation factor SUI1
LHRENSADDHRKRELYCNGTVVEDKELGNVIQLQGDHRKKVAAFIAKAGLAKTDCIKVHTASSHVVQIDLCPESLV